jgi:hypothetical protein
MLQPRGHPDLALEPVGSHRSAELGMEHLECDWTVLLEIVRQIDGRHAASAELLLDPVPIRQAALQLLEPVYHSDLSEMRNEAGELTAGFGNSLWQPVGPVA